MQAVRSRTLIMFLMLLAGVAQARDLATIVNYENTPIVTGSNTPPTLEAVAKAIKTAGVSQGYPWTSSGDAPGAMQLTTVVRGKHTVVLNVTFDTKTYSIKYASSVNLDYRNKDGKDLIHPNYNKWVAALKHAIDIEFAKL